MKESHGGGMRIESPLGFIFGVVLAMLFPPLAILVFVAFQYVARHRRIIGGPP